MKEKQERLNKVYRYLISIGKVATQKDFAALIKMSRTSLSAALNGNESYLTDGLMSKIVTYFPEISLSWLIEGTGTMLEGGNPPNVTELPEEQSSLVNALLAAKDETIEAQQRELKTKDELIRFLKEENERLKSEKNDSHQWHQAPMGVAEKQRK